MTGSGPIMDRGRHQVTGIVWRPVYGYEGLYEVSSNGDVRSVDRWLTSKDGKTRFYAGQTVRPSTSRRGYKRIICYKEGCPPKTRTLHSLVLEAFVSPRPIGYLGCHNNGDPADNRLENLRWDTASANCADMEKHGTNNYRNRDNCPRGHRLVENNIQESKKKEHRRACKSCHQARSDVHNGSVLSFDEMADMRYYMNVHGLSFRHGERRTQERVVYLAAQEWLSNKSGR